MQHWYDYNRSRANSEVMFAPNGSVLRSNSFDEDVISEASVIDDNEVHLPSILKNDDGEEVNRFSRF
jgi:hypothetical protein